MTSDVSAGASSVLSKELQLSNGVTLSNRIAQSAMTEHLATGDGAPSWQLIEAYGRFAVSGASTLPNRKPIIGLVIMLVTTQRDTLIIRTPRLASTCR
jgi:hypothetical protein